VVTEWLFEAGGVIAHFIYIHHERSAVCISS